jgi:4-methyl-5(b-hydroxyethyl)-thiazole monophosphate biosynthesis
MEFSVFVDIMGWARDEEKVNVEVVTCGFNKTVVSTFGIPIIMDTLIDDIDANDYDAIAIPGGFQEYGFREEAFDIKTQELIRKFNFQNKPIASICVAAFALAKSGILNGRRATTYHLLNGARQKELALYEGIMVINEPIVIDGNIITSYNPQTASDVAFKLLEMLSSKDKVHSIKRMMGFIE